MLAADRLVAERAADADAALVAAAASLGPAVDLARRGAARTVEGDEAPGPTLEEAASAVALAGPAIGSASDAVADLNAALLARDPAASTVPSAPSEIGSIATQLEETSAAADAFAEMRRRATRLGTTLDEVLRALEAGEGAIALARVEEARFDHAQLAGWDVGLVTLPVWLETTDAMIDAVETIVEATGRGDAEAAAAGADALAALAEEAATADRALRIAIGEGGSAVTAAPLGRLAAVLTALDEQRAQVAAIVHESGAR